jgi:opacity protein-like surface antigen
MRLILRSLILSSAALCASTAFAAKRVQLNVPFNFVANNHVYRAGTYGVEVETDKSVVKLISISESTSPLMWIVGPGNNDNHSKVRLTFDRVGPDVVLRTIQYGELTTRNLDMHPRHDVEGTRTVGE